MNSVDVLNKAIKNSQHLHTELPILRDLLGRCKACKKKYSPTFCEDGDSMADCVDRYFYDLEENIMDILNECDPELELGHVELFECQYCKNNTVTNIELLCNECSEMFGHKRFDEL